MSEELSDKDIQKIFNQTSKALRDNDPEKLEAILANETSVEEEPSLPDQPEIETPVEKEEEDKQDDTPQDTADESGDDNEDPIKPQESEDIVKLREQLAKLEKDNHSLRSQAGRVPHVQRRLQELDKRLEELTKAKPTPSSQLSEKTLERIKSIRDTDEELADTLLGILTEATNSSAQEAHKKEVDTLTFMREQEAAAAHQSELDRLTEMYPNAIDVFKSPTWKDWKQKQSRTWQMLAGSDSADDVSEAFEKYARDMAELHPELKKQVETKEPVVNEEAKKIEEDRARKKSTAAVVNTPKAPAKVSMPEDPEALFKQISERIRKERTG